MPPWRARRGRSAPGAGRRRSAPSRAPAHPRRSAARSAPFRAAGKPRPGGAPASSASPRCGPARPIRSVRPRTPRAARGRPRVEIAGAFVQQPGHRIGGSGAARRILRRAAVEREGDRDQGYCMLLDEPGLDARARRFWRCARRRRPRPGPCRSARSCRFVLQKISGDAAARATDGPSRHAARRLRSRRRCGPAIPGRR